MATRELAQADQRRRALNVQQAMLQARPRMLEQRERALLRDEGERWQAADPAFEAPGLRRRLEEIDTAMARYGAGGLDRQLQIVRDTLLAAGQTIRIEPCTLRLDAMNTVLGESACGGVAVEFERVRAAEISRAFAVVRVRRGEMPAGGLPIAAVERSL
jgi:hypothetical protein